MVTSRAATGPIAASSIAVEVAMWRQAPAKSSSSSHKFKKISMRVRLYVPYAPGSVLGLTDDTCLTSPNEQAVCLIMCGRYLLTAWDVSAWMCVTSPCGTRGATRRL